MNFLLLLALLRRRFPLRLRLDPRLVQLELAPVLLLPLSSSFGVSSSIAAFTSLSSFVFRSLSSRCRSSHSSTVAFNSAFRLSRNATVSACVCSSAAISRLVASISARSPSRRCACVRARHSDSAASFFRSNRRSAPVAFFFSASDAFNPGLGLPSTTWSRGASIFSAFFAKYFACSSFSVTSLERSSLTAALTSRSRSAASRIAASSALRSARCFRSEGNAPVSSISTIVADSSA